MIDTQRMKVHLEEMLSEITKELKTLGVQDPDLPADWVTAQRETANEADLNDVADRTEEYDTSRATLSVLETRFNNIRKALEKIEADTYGKCEICDSKIEEDRLEANPAARTCKEHLEDENKLSI